MPLEIRPFSGTIEDYGRVVDIAFGSEYHAEDVPALDPFFRTFDALGAYDGEQMVGGAALWRTSLTVPGGELATAAVTSVGVLPTHRRRGALTGMMRRQLADVHEQGLPLAALWASEGAIYQRFGYGMATINATIDAERQRITFRDRREPIGRVRFAGDAEARELIPRLFEEVRLTRAGFYSRPDDYWNAEIFYDPPHHRRGGGPLLSVIHETDGTPDGYAVYRIIQDWDARGPKSTLQLYELQATSATAVRELWEYAFGVDLVGTLRARPLAVDTPLLWSVTEPRRLGMTIGDGLWLRIVDVAAALEGRGYAAEDRLVIQLRDGVCDWNDGRWALDASRDGARVQPSSEDPDLALDAADLAAVYLGGGTVAELLSANRCQELSRDAAGRFDALFRTDLAPWCPLIF
jgi:predicted acetyltransferase